MSLLIDALTRAEKAKKRAEGQGESAKFESRSASAPASAPASTSTPELASTSTPELEREPAPGPEFELKPEPEPEPEFELKPAPELEFELKPEPGPKSGPELKLELKPGSGLDLARTPQPRPAIGLEVNSADPDFAPPSVSPRVAAVAKAAATRGLTTIDDGPSPTKARTIFLAKKSTAGWRSLQERPLLLALGIVGLMSVIGLSSLSYRHFLKPPAVNQADLEARLPLPVPLPAAPRAADQPPPPVDPPPAAIVAIPVAPPPQPDPVVVAPVVAAPDVQPAPTPPEEAIVLPDRPRPIVITRRTAPPAIDQTLEEAYDAYKLGDIERAARIYRQILQLNPGQRQALLGIAATYYRRGEIGLAATYYRRLLDRDPGDPMALAGMLLTAPVGDISRSLSELRLLLLRHPDNAALHFGLGNLLAAQHDWPAARLAYTKALALALAGALRPPAETDASAADYAFNLAVSLEHLGLNYEAARHYRKALTLAGLELAVSFDRNLVNARIAILENDNHGRLPDDEREETTTPWRNPAGPGNYHRRPTADRDH
ncbi:MAG: tetratricopeptide repeat protein [Desulfobulbaceae bacterium]|nr:MAG: tetratricopeptide repeat protein [Desulfobulbaceae bacterium]